MKWRFPDTIDCPKQYCTWQLNFDFSNVDVARNAAMAHYRKEHAKNDLLCVLCNTLISMSSQSNMIQHYGRKHPNARIPEPLPVPTTSKDTVSESTMVSADKLNERKNTPSAINNNKNKNNNERSSSRRSRKFHPETESTNFITSTPVESGEQSNLRPATDRPRRSYSRHIRFADVSIKYIFSTWSPNNYLVVHLS